MIINQNKNRKESNIIDMFNKENLLFNRFRFSNTLTPIDLPSMCFKIPSNVHVVAFIRYISATYRNANPNQIYVDIAKGFDDLPCFIIVKRKSLHWS